MWVHPPIADHALRIAEDEALVILVPIPSSFACTDQGHAQEKELQWYLNSLQSSLAALKEGLEECVKLLAPVEPGSTLVLSSLRSESVKGHVTRIGTKIVRGVSDHPDSNV